MKIIWSPLALERIEDISRYIAEDNPDAALQWVNDLFATVERLADFPKSGRMVPEVGGAAYQRADIWNLSGYL
ncbi:MAG: type II toxin-antitoxin system RelE/ParE family toxin [Marinobacter sp.]|nr:type II toxin-antitoxin system RelE/ParE family toxin [Marinobacter sp.]